MEPFTVFKWISLPPPLICPSTDLLMRPFTVTGKSVLIFPFTVDAFRCAFNPLGSVASMPPFVVFALISCCCSPLPVTATLMLPFVVFAVIGPSTSESPIFPFVVLACIAPNYSGKPDAAVGGFRIDCS